MGMTRYDSGGGHVVVTLPEITLPPPSMPIMMSTERSETVMAVNRLYVGFAGIASAVSFIAGMVIGRLWC